MLLLITMGKTFYVTLAGNLIYLLTCSTCNIQYVEETALSLHKRVNIHQAEKPGWEYKIKLFRNNCAGSSFSIQILEIIKSDGYVNRKKTRKERPLHEHIEN